MEIDIKSYRIPAYVYRLLNNSKRKTEKYYIENFDPFYKWRIGKLYENEIKSELIAFYANNELRAELKKNEFTIKLLALLIKTIKEVTKNKFPESFTEKEWLKIREDYEGSKKKEFENALNVIAFNEEINYKGPGLDDSIEEGYKLYDFILGEDVEKEISEETIIKALSKSLMDISDSEWIIRFIRDKNLNFKYHFAVLNNTLSDETSFDYGHRIITEYLIEKTFNYATELKFIGTTYYIEGYFNLT
jgi:hypothetical protein